jgi:hypothetical protein
MGRETGVSKEAISQGISADLPMLHPTSTSGFSNILDFEEKMSFYLKREFGPIGKIIKSNRYPEIPTPEPLTREELLEDEFGLVKSSYMAKEKEYRLEVRDLEKRKAPVFAVLYTQMSKESINVCSRHHQWDDAIHNEDDPLLLWEYTFRISIRESAYGPYRRARRYGAPTSGTYTVYSGLQEEV